MNCRESQRLLYEALDPGAPERHAGLAEHLSACLTCRNLQRDLQLIRQNAQLHVEAPLADGFELALRRRLTELEQRSGDSESSKSGPAYKSSSKRKRLPRRAVAAILAVAASAALFWIGTSLITSGDGDQRSSSYHRLSVAVEAFREVPNALFEVELPDGVRVAPQVRGLLGHGNRLRWESRLRPGINSFEIPLHSTRSDVKIRAHVAARGQSSSATVTVGRSQVPRAAKRHAGPTEVALVVGLKTAGKARHSW
jgi:hypothetical protein